GVFTLGEENVEVLRKITEANSELDVLTGQIEGLRNTLNGADGVSGKAGELSAFEEALKEKCWAQKQKHDAKLKAAFEGYRNSADKFKGKVLQELANNTATLEALADLEKRATTVFGEAPTRENSIPVINTEALVQHETDPVLGKRVLGKEDVDIAAMINRLGNSDWVRQGRAFYQANESLCPFCQQKTEEAFANSLEEYFDEAFDADTRAISDLETNYKTDAARLQQEVASIISTASRYLDIEKLKLEKQLLDSIISGNLQKLASKKKEPSQVIDLDSIVNAVSAITTVAGDANTLINEHNTTVENIVQERQTLTAQVWKYVLEELKADLTDYGTKKTALDTAITSLSNQISTKTSEKQQKAQEVRSLEEQTTSIQPTIDGINALLTSFGFHGFLLEKAEGDRFYKLVRADGADAKTTLSEGERTFVTFLYFYHLLKGSNSESGVTSNRVVVFDDPVSSLDSDVLFIVSSLIKGLFEDVRAGNGYIKQIFVFTHNVYFHKEVSFNARRPHDAVMNEETFWVVRKSGTQTKVEKQNTNPIKTSYELLWTEVKKPDVSSLTIQNTLRRILENYFKILGGIDPDEICTKFEGRNRLICKSLFSWVNDGSHSVHDDLYVSNADTTVDTYLQIFREIFQKTNHIAHYDMMMGSSESEGEQE
ncbi:Translation-disabling ACNase RloC, partial [hydrothermal vent metagenome]